MQLIRFIFTILHTPGKDPTIAATLSCALSAMPSDADTHFNQDTEMFIATVMSCLPATEIWLTEITQKQEEDEVCKQLKQYCQSGWPRKHQVPETLNPYYSVSSELTIQHGILMHKNRMAIPSSLLEDYTQDTRELLNATEEPYSLCGGLVSKAI